jgi:hypothetical protein
MVMEVFRDLFVNIDEGGMDALVELIERSLPPGWARDREAEMRIRSTPFAARPTYCFTCESDGRSASARLILTERKPGTFYVSNIIPISGDRLSYAEYNDVLEEFYNNALRPSAEQSGVSATLTEAQADLDHWMTPATAEKLRAFSACANKGTGSAHPRDRERWNEFVLSAHRDGSQMDASTLQRWLVEAEGWSPEAADQLALEYEYGRELLAFAEEPRRSA